MTALTTRRWFAGLLEHLGDVVEAVGALALHVGGGLQEVADHLDPRPAVMPWLDSVGRIVVTSGDYTDRAFPGERGHALSDDCPCRPGLLPVARPRGGVAWERIHQPMTDRASTED